MMKQKNWLKVLSCSVFAGLYLIVAAISLVCSTEFFRLAHSGIMSWVLAIGFEIGAMSCLLSTLILPKKKLGLVWFMFIVLTLFQCMGNMYAAFVNLEDFQDWIDMFGMTDMELIAQKRVLAGISGIILPLVALGFIRIMADVLQDGHKIETNDEETEEEPKPLFGETEKPVEKTEPVEIPKQVERPKPKQQEIKLPVKEIMKKTEEKPVRQKEQVQKEPEKNQKKPESRDEQSTGRIWNNNMNPELG